MLDFKYLLSVSLFAVLANGLRGNKGDGGLNDIVPLVLDCDVEDLIIFKLSLALLIPSMFLANVFSK